MVPSFNWIGCRSTKPRMKVQILLELQKRWQSGLMHPGGIPESPEWDREFESHTLLLEVPSRQRYTVLKTARLGEIPACRLDSYYLRTEVVRMDEELVLKTSGCKRLGGSIPFASAIGE